MIVAYFKNRQIGMPIKTERKEKLNFTSQLL